MAGKYQMSFESKNVDKDAKKFQPSDDFLQNVLQSYLVALLTHFLEMESPDQVPPSAGKEISRQWLQDKAHEFVVKVTGIGGSRGGEMGSFEPPSCRQLLILNSLG